MIACWISFDSHDWAQKSDIRVTTYEHIDLLMRSCVCLHELSHIFGILFITLPMSFKILTFKFHMIACAISFDSPTYEHFYLRMRYCVCLHELWHNFGIVFIPHPLSIKILTFKFHMIARSIRFDSHVWTQKSDITRANYEHFYLVMRWYVCLHELSHNFGILFINIPLLLNSKWYFCP